jgi:hypothetical protein
MKCRKGGNLTPVSRVRIQRVNALQWHVINQERVLFYVSSFKVYKSLHHSIVDNISYEFYRQKFTHCWTKFLNLMTINAYIKNFLNINWYFIPMYISCWYLWLVQKYLPKVFNKTHTYIHRHRFTLQYMIRCKGSFH